MSTGFKETMFYQNQGSNVYRIQQQQNVQEVAMQDKYNSAKSRDAYLMYWYDSWAAEIRASSVYRSLW